MSDGMPVVRTAAELRAAVAHWQAAGQRVALVPTMGALHAGHLALIAEALRHAERVAASIFVNPRQFGPNEDFARYPRDEAGDAAKLAGAGCHLLYAPDVAAVYPPGFATEVRVLGLGEVLCGAARPGHFDGVATVVTKLLTSARADVAVFGEKDWQQLAIIRRLAADLDLGTAIIGATVVRDSDGLAFSSRNAYLATEERRQAVALPAALTAARQALLAGGDAAPVLAEARAALLAAGFNKVDYVALVDGASLLPLDRAAPGARLLAAAFMGRTRLIDNLAV